LPSHCLSLTSARTRPCKSPLTSYTRTKSSPLKVKTSNAIISLNLACLMWTYVVSIACLLHRRVHRPELLPKTQWSLGQGGVATNVAALAYSAFAFFWSFWPNLSTLSLVDFNWAIAMLLATLVLAKIDWELRAKYAYLGPVHKITAVVEDERTNTQ
jgi:hypothetical protein